MLPIIDTHQHLWDLRRLRLPWIARGSHLDRNFLTRDYRKATEGLNVVRTVYMEVDADPACQDEEAAIVLRLCRRADNPMSAAVIGGHPASPGFAAHVERWRDKPRIKGMRQILHTDRTPPGYCLQKEFIEGVRLLGESGLIFDLCLRPGELGDGAKLIDACPDTRFVLDHCGNADVQARSLAAWKRGMVAVARRKNVVGKVSGIVVSAKPYAWTADDLAPAVRHTLEVFGPDRVMFGGDWPVCTKAATFADWLTALKEIVSDLPSAEQRKLFHDNAVRFYGLEK